MNSKRSKNYISYWYDEYDILYKVNESYTSNPPKKKLSSKNKIFTKLF